MPEIKVSVIIPTFNRAKLIKRSIQSVLDQTYQDFEVIIVDDGSTDDTKSVIESFKNPRIKYISHDINKGPSAARNAGIKNAKGKYIAFQDSDDEWLPEKLEKQMECFDTVSPRVSIVYCGLWRKKDKNISLIPPPSVSPKDGDINLFICRGNFIAMPTVVCEKECFNKAGLFDEKFHHFEDWELLIRLSRYSRIKYIDEPLVMSYFTPGGVNEQGLIAEAKTTKQIFDKHYEEFKNNKQLLALYQYQIGNLLCQTEQYSEGKKSLLNAVKLDTLNQKYLTAYLISFFGKNIYRIFAALKINITLHREKRYAKNFR